MSKRTELILYVLTVLYCFIISGTGMGDTGHVDSYLAKRALFYIIEAGLLVMAAIRCRRLLSRYDEDYFRSTQKLFDAVERCFVPIAIVSVFGVVEMIPIVVFLPSRISDGAANGLVVLLLLTGLTFVLYNIVTSRFYMVKKQRWKITHSKSESLEDFFSFIHSSERQKEPATEKMSDPLIDDLVPDEEDFRRHLQRISGTNTNPPAESKQPWECHCCGTTNRTDSLQCMLCGADRRQ